MGDRNLTAEEALAYLMKKVEARDSFLATHLQRAIDAGKEVAVVGDFRVPVSPADEHGVTVTRVIGDVAPAGVTPQPIRSPPRRRQVQAFTDQAPLTHREALFVTIECLRAYLLTLPLCLNSVIDEVAASGQRGGGSSRAGRSPAVDGIGAEKRIVLELRTETQISTDARPEVLPIEKTRPEWILETQENLARLQQLVESLQ